MQTFRSGKRNQVFGSKQKYTTHNRTVIFLFFRVTSPLSPDNAWCELCNRLDLDSGVLLLDNLWPLATECSWSPAYRSAGLACEWTHMHLSAVSMSPGQQISIKSCGMEKGLQDNGEGSGALTANMVLDTSVIHHYLRPVREEGGLCGWWVRCVCWSWDQYFHFICSSVWQRERERQSEWHAHVDIRWTINLWTVVTQSLWGCPSTAKAAHTQTLHPQLIWMLCKCPYGKDHSAQPLLHSPFHLFMTKVSFKWSEGTDSLSSSLMHLCCELDEKKTNNRGR